MTSSPKSIALTAISTAIFLVACGASASSQQTPKPSTKAQTTQAPLSKPKAASTQTTPASDHATNPAAKPSTTLPEPPQKTEAAKPAPEESKGHSIDDVSLVKVEGSKESLAKLPDTNGFLRDHVRPSVLDCQQQHQKKQRRLRKKKRTKLGKVTVIVELKPDGSIEKYKLEPATLDTTVFGKCMEKRRQSWTVNAFESDDTIEIADTYFLVR